MSESPHTAPDAFSSAPPAPPAPLAPAPSPVANEAVAAGSEPGRGGARQSRRKRWLRRLLIGAAALLLLAGIGGELAARFILGMGDPPLYTADPKIEYLPVPGRTYSRFGNTISYNSSSMRSPEFPAAKADPAELRVMVIGDSIVNGGSPSDQSELATTLLPGILGEELRRPVVVGNISCGSWGPPNQLEYVRRFGLFDADAVIIVLNSEDSFDVPTFAPLGAELPTSTPILALHELFSLYVPKAFRYHVLGEREEAPKEGPSAEDTREALAALEQLVETVRSSGAKVAIVHHFKFQELQTGRPEKGYDEIRRAAARLGVRLADTKEEMTRLLVDEHRGYRDDIHPDAAGQEALAGIIAREVKLLLRP